MIVAITILSALGIFLMLLGRFLILKEAPGLSRGWRIAVAIVPLADLVFLAGSWEKAKAGAAACAIGLALISPVAGQLIWDATQLRDMRAAGQRFHDQVTQMITTDRQTREEQAERASRENLLRYKETKVRELGQHLIGWHASLETRRAAFIAGGNGDLAAFDDEAVDYHALLAIAKEEAAELKKLEQALSGS
jgi:multisubunit Na+/H+ antiporter MnhG subunit